MIKKKDLQVYECVVFLGKNKPQTNCQSNSQSTDKESILNIKYNTNICMNKRKLFIYIRVLYIL